MNAVRVAAPLLLLLDLGCAAAAIPSTPPCPASPSDPPSASTVATTPAALPTEADVIRWSHDAIDAWAPDGREDVLAGVAKRKSRAFDTRVWSDEHVQVREPFIIFVGEAKEHQAGNTVHGGYDIAGAYSLVWCREGSRGSSG